MGNPKCHHVVVGTLVLHQNRLAVAMRQKPPRCLAPSAGHADPEDGEIPESRSMAAETLKDVAARELREECGLRAEPGQLEHLFTYRASDDCAKPGADGEPGGNHLWFVYLFEVKTISRPTLDDEPGKMHGWEWRSVDSLLADPDLEPIWAEMLTLIGPTALRP